MVWSPTLPVWPTVRHGKTVDYKIYALQDVDRRSTRTGEVGTYRLLQVADWTNVIALTPDDQVVLIEQYRHGVDAVTLEIPGGMVDAGEDSALAAARELREETGFEGGEPELLGRVQPNPAIQDNETTTYLIRDCQPTAQADPDPGEHILVHTVPLAEIPQLLRGGQITHSLVIAAFHWLHLHQD